MYTCVRCDVKVKDDERVEHSATSTHQENGGSAEVVEEDYSQGGGGRGLDPTGTSNIR